MRFFPGLARRGSGGIAAASLSGVAMFEDWDSSQRRGDAAGTLRRAWQECRGGASSRDWRADGGDRLRGFALGAWVYRGDAGWRLQGSSRTSTPLTLRLNSSLILHG